MATTMYTVNNYRYKTIEVNANTSEIPTIEGSCLMQLLGLGNQNICSVALNFPFFFLTTQMF